jgi:DNA repair exonuclease SbcCD ATPase subunit
MGKMILSVLLVVLALHSLALLGFLGYGLATERFDDEKRVQYLATWQGEKLVPPLPVEVVEEKEESPQESSSRIQAAQQEREILTREMRMFAQLLRDKEVSLQDAQAKLEKDLKALRSELEQFDARVGQHKKMAQEESFRKALKNYSSMKPKYTKDDFMKMDEKDVVRYLSEMKSATATAILEQFKTPQEQNKRLKLMKMLEQYGVVDPRDKDKRTDELVSNGE